MTWTLKTLALGAALSVGLAAGGAVAGAAVKVGVVAPFSGPFAIYGKQFKDAIKAYQEQHGTSAGGHQIEFIYKDSGGPNPAAAKSATQDLLIRDRVNYLAGFTFTPNALAVAPLITKAHTPTVIFNAATSIITQKSPYFVRTSFTLAQVAAPMADWALANGIKTVVTAVTDYGPGIDAEKAFSKAFTAKGGKVIDKIRMPIQTSDFGPYMQRIKAKKPDALFTFIPAGPPAFAFVKAYNDNGLKADGIKFLGTGDVDDETTLQALGDAALGIMTAHHYSAAHQSKANSEFLAALHKADPGALANFASVGAYDGMHVLYAMIAKHGADGKAAIKGVLGMKWESPRGPVRIDPKTRTLDQNVYIRTVAKGADGKLINKEVETFKMVPDLGLVSK